MDWLTLIEESPADLQMPLLGCEVQRIDII